MNLDDMAPPGYKIYNVPGTVSEFRLFQKIDGTLEHHVRYVNKSVGYTGKWMVIQTTKEEINDNTNRT